MKLNRAILLGSAAVALTVVCVAAWPLRPQPNQLRFVSGIRKGERFEAVKERALRHGFDVSEYKTDYSKGLSLGRLTWLNVFREESLTFVSFTQQLEAKSALVEYYTCFIDDRWQQVDFH